MLEHAAPSARLEVCAKAVLPGAAISTPDALYAYKGRPKPAEPQKPAVPAPKSPKDAPAPPPEAPKPTEPPKAAK
jgi:hypothetical protein